MNCVDRYIRKHFSELHYLFKELLALLENRIVEQSGEIYRDPDLAVVAGYSTLIFKHQPVTGDQRATLSDGFRRFIK